MGALRRRPVPVVQFLTPTHPAEAAPRQAKLEAARPIEVGDNA
jgi:maltose O-acetyltransferase